VELAAHPLMLVLLVKKDIIFKEQLVSQNVAMDITWTQEQVLVKNARQLA